MELLGGLSESMKLIVFLFSFVVGYRRLAAIMLRKKKKTKEKQLIELMNEAINPLNQPNAN